MSLNVADDGRSAVFEYNTEGINYPFEGQVDIMVSWANGYYSLGSTINFPMKWRGLKSWLVGYAMKMITEPYPSKSPIFQYYGKHKILTLPPCEVFEGQNYVYLTVDILHQNSYVLYVCNLPLRYDEGQDIFVRAAIIEDYFGPLKIKVSRLSDETRWSEFEDFEYDKNSFFITPIWVSKNNLLYQEVGNKYYEPTLEYYEGGK